MWPARICVALEPRYAPCRIMTISNRPPGGFMSNYFLPPVCLPNEETRPRQRASNMTVLETIVNRCWRYVYVCARARDGRRASWTIALLSSSGISARRFLAGTLRDNRESGPDKLTPRPTERKSSSTMSESRFNERNNLEKKGNFNFRFVHE